MKILAPISLGELVDKITILELKIEYITDPDKLININNELKELARTLNEIKFIPSIDEDKQRLKEVNRSLWHIENFKRECEHKGKFDREFTLAAREVYIKNDLRAEIKRTINQKTGSSIVEEKSYSK